MLNLPLVSRERELAEIDRRLDSARSGRGSLMLVGGESGIGKTALIRAAAAGSDVPLAMGHCSGPAETPLFGPWVEALCIADALGAMGQADLPAPLGEAPPENSAIKLAAAVVKWLRWARPPLWLVLEDIHWSDAASLHLLRHVAPHLPQLPVLLIATYRTDETGPMHPLWQALPELERSGATRLMLDRLSREAVTQLAAAALPSAPGLVSLAGYLHDRTDGHPLFVSELLASAPDAAPLLLENQPLPATVQQAVDRKLSRLSPKARRVLEVAAIVGARFSASVLVSAGVGNAEEVDDALHEGLSHAVLRLHDRSGQSFAFDHALMREGLASRLIGERRRLLHRQVAEGLLVQTPGTMPDAAFESVAVHLERAGDTRAAVYLMAAGDRAQRLGSLAVAADFYRRALTKEPVAERRLTAELSLKLGYACRHSDRLEALHLWQQAKIAAQGQDGPVEAWTEHMIALWHYWQAHPESLPMLERVRPLQESLLSDERYQQLERDLFGEVGGYARIAVTLVMALAKIGRRDEARRLLDDLRRLARPGARCVDLLHAEYWLVSYTGSLEDAIELGLRVSDQAGALGSYRLAADLEGNRLYQVLLARADQPDQVDAVAHRLEALLQQVAEQSGEDLLARGYPPLGWFQFLRGDWTGASHNLMGYLERNPADREPGMRGFAALLLTAQGKTAGARAVLSALEPVRPADAPTLHSMQIAAYSWRANLALADGTAEEARSWLEAADRYMATRNQVGFRSAHRLAWARYYLQIGDYPAADREGRQALALAEERREFRFRILARLLLGEVGAGVGSLQDADRHLLEALSLAERCRFPYYTALAQLARAKVVRGAPGVHAGLMAARAVFVRLGAVPALAEADALAGSAQAAAFPAGLSQREAEVSRLVAAGLTDKEVAARLFLSPRTVDNHLRRIFAKVGVNSRAALAAFAARNGLADL